MFRTYLVRELVNRRRQTVIIAVGMALAIALVIVVNAFSAGVTKAQASVLSSVYGVGTDITVTKAATAASGGPQQFDFGSGSGSTSGNAQSLSQNVLRTDFTTTAYDASALSTVKAVAHVKNASAVLSLMSTSFSGTIPTFTPGQRPSAPTGGADGAGGSSFSVNNTTVIGLDPATTSRGPLSATTLTSGRSFTAADQKADVVVLDSNFATSKSLTVGSTTEIGGTTFTVIGIVSSASSTAATAANEYIPLGVAQSLSSETGKITGIYVQADSSSDVSQLQAALTKALPGYTVSTQADLASSVSGSLSSASSLVAGLGSWLSVIVLFAAFLIAILFTISGVTRRTREFGTLKAIGWNNGRIIRQVAGESVVQGLLGGVIGVAVGLATIAILNASGLSLSASTAGTARSFGPGGGPAGAIPSAAATGAAGAGGGVGSAAGATSTIVLNLPYSIGIVLIAVGLAVLGGLLAGAIGGSRAARLRPADALRSVG